MHKVDTKLKTPAKEHQEKKILRKYMESSFEVQLKEDRDGITRRKWMEMETNGLWAMPHEEPEDISHIRGLHARFVV